MSIEGNTYSDLSNQIENAANSSDIINNFQLRFESWQYDIELSDEVTSLLQKLDLWYKKNPNNNEFIDAKTRIIQQIWELSNSIDYNQNWLILNHRVELLSKLISDFSQIKQLQSNHRKQEGQISVTQYQSEQSYLHSEAIKILKAIWYVDFAPKNNSYNEYLMSFAEEQSKHINFLAEFPEKVQVVFRDTHKQVQEMYNCIDTKSTGYCLDNMAKDFWITYENLLSILNTQTWYMIALQSVKAISWFLKEIPTPKDLLYAIIDLDDAKEIIDELKEYIV